MARIFGRLKSHNKLSAFFCPNFRRNIWEKSFYWRKKISEKWFFLAKFSTNHFRKFIFRAAILSFALSDRRGRYAHAYGICAYFYNISLKKEGERFISKMVQLFLVSIKWLFSNGSSKIWPDFFFRAITIWEAIQKRSHELLPCLNIQLESPSHSSNYRDSEKITITFLQRL